MARKRGPGQKRKAKRAQQAGESARLARYPSFLLGVSQPPDLIRELSFPPSVRLMDKR